MTKGTIIRTILVIATCFNTALMATDVAQFNNPKLDYIYKVLSVVANFVIVFCATWFNNDYTEEACKGTGYTRQLKEEKKPDYVGERFYTDDDGELIEADIDFEDGMDGEGDGYEQ